TTAVYTLSLHDALPIFGVRREPGPADLGGPAARSDLALRRREARRRAVLHQLQPRLPLLRNGRPALLQRLRAAPEPVLAVRGGRSAVHRGDRPGRADYDLRRRR